MVPPVKAGPAKRLGAIRTVWLRRSLAVLALVILVPVKAPISVLCWPFEVIGAGLMAAWQRAHFFHDDYGSRLLALGFRTMWDADYDPDDFTGSMLRSKERLWG